jgi:four helix bundle protein
MEMEETTTFRSPSIRSFRDLEVWQKAMDLAVDLHQLARRLPDEERYELARDFRRTARSIAANIAEGFNRHSRATYRLHVAIALGSQAELETQVELARRLGHIDDTTCAKTQQSIASIGRLLHGLWRALGSKPPIG